MNRVLKLAGIAVLATNAAACATITRGTQQAWEVQTTPAGARVTTSHGFQCPSTPCSIRMPRESVFTAEIAKDGYETVNVSVTHETAGGGAAGMAGNLILGGVIGAVVDANNGATQNLTPNPVVVTLTPIGGSVAPASAATAAAAAPADAAAAAPAPGAD